MNKAIKLLMKNHETRPSSASFPKVNATINNMNLFHALLWLNKAMNF